MLKILAALMLIVPFAMGPAGATMSCDGVVNLVCTGDSVEDPYAACDGVWVDVWVLGLSYAQVCDGYDGTTHVYVCPLAGDWTSPNCDHRTVILP